MADIKNIQDLISGILGKDKEYVAAKTARLTIPGDNYGSSILSVDITVRNKEGQSENVHAVAKMLPENEFIRKVFNSEYTFRNEVGFYQVIAPHLRDFQREQGVSELFDSFPAFYGARLSLDSESTKLDEDAVLLIKNLRGEGFHNVDRTVGFNLDQTKLILHKMAELHGTFLAFKSFKSDVYDREISDFFKEFKIFDFDGDKGPGIEVMTLIIEMIKDDEFCSKHLDTVKNRLEAISQNMSAKNRKDQEIDPFFSLLHCDMWSNNIMIKTFNDKPIDVKFVDYQLYEYSSITRDVIFFLFTSVQLPVIQQHCDSLLNFYYENFIQCLEKLKYDTSVFSFEAFVQNLKEKLREMEFFHIMLMLGPIYADKEHIKNVEEMNEDALVSQRKGVSQQCKEKAIFIIKEFITRGWI